MHYNLAQLCMTGDTHTFCPAILTFVIFRERLRTCAPTEVLENVQRRIICNRKKQNTTQRSTKGRMDKWTILFKSGPTCGNENELWPFTTMRTYLTDITVRESSQTQKKTHCMIPFTQSSKASKHHTVLSQNSKGTSKGWRLSERGCQGTSEGLLSVQFIKSWINKNFVKIQSCAFWFVHFLFECYKSIKKLPKEREGWRTIWPGKTGAWNMFWSNSCMCALGEACVLETTRRSINTIDTLW